MQKVTDVHKITLVSCDRIGSGGRVFSLQAWEGCTCVFQDHALRVTQLGMFAAAAGLIDPSMRTADSHSQLEK